MFKKLPLVVSLVLSFLFMGLLSGVHSLSIPPLAQIFNPWSGVWQNIEKGDERFSRWNAKLQRAYQKTFPKSQVEAPRFFFDQEARAYLFAERSEDLYFAQGFLTAKERLWQMDMTWRAHSGRLSEVIGKKGLSLDRWFVQIGMGQAVDSALQEIRKDKKSWSFLQAYVRGVNAYIQSLSSKEFPIEYKLMGFSPELWSEKKSITMIKMMAYRLSWENTDVEMARLYQKFSDEAIADLYPVLPKNNRPIIPQGTMGAWVKGVAPQAPRSFFRTQPETLENFEKVARPIRSNGSNNWAVSAALSKTGYPILANDTHLKFSLPALWYKVQLQVRGQSPVAGASLPGVPGVVIGFNPKVAWAVTNAVVDVTDFFEVRIKEGKYYFDGNWKPLRFVENKIPIQNQKTQVEVVPWTHYGPVLGLDRQMVLSSQEKKALVLRWLGHDQSNELAVFLKLNQSSSFAQCWQALKGFNNPAQNFICVDSVDIGLIHNGRIPLKWPRQGSFVGDGGSSLYQWQGFVEREQNPQVINPKRGFVSSANNHPVDESYPYYLNFYYSPSYRNQRITNELAQGKKFFSQDLQQLQNDVLDLHAQEALPLMLKAVQLEKLNRQEKSWWDRMSRWDYQMQATQEEPSFWFFWWRELENEIWKKQLGHRKKVIYPDPNRLVRLLRKPRSKWWEPAGRQTQLTTSFITALKLLKKKGEQVGGLRWAAVKEMKLHHMAKIPGFGTPLLSVGGSEQTVNANTGPHGPNWKMVVEMGPSPRALMIYPGGQSGNPASRYYQNFIWRWSQGELIPFEFRPEKSFVEKGGQ